MECGNLWIVDQRVQKISDTQPVILPGLFAYNFQDQKVSYKYRFPAEMFAGRSSLPTTLITDSYYGCDEQKLILADTLGHCILVLDLRTESSWQICHPSMANDPNYSDFTFENYTFPNFQAGVYTVLL